MTRRSAITLIAGALAACSGRGASPAAQNAASEVPAVETAITQWFDSGLARMDTLAVARGLSPTFAIFEDTMRYDKPGFVMLVAGLRGTLTLQYTLSEWNTKVQDGVAWSSFRNRAVLTPTNGSPAQLEWLETAVLLKVADHWVIDRYQSTPVHRAAPH